MFSEDRDRASILAYLNGSDVGCMARRSKKVDLRSLLSELPGSLSASKTQSETGSDGSYLAKTADGSHIDQQHLIRSIKQHMAGRQRDVWKDKVSQGKSVACQTAASNAFVRGPTQLKPEEVVSALIARSAQLPIRAHLKKIKASKVSSCRHCTADPETLAYVLNHCPLSIDSKIKERHSKALERTATAIKRNAVNRNRTLQIDSSPAGMKSLLRADILHMDDRRKRIAMAGVAIV
ncbi:hypothetical protein EMWEY_00055330 [Eimeria maxima]|uniref:Uncharacterized protein n=1 Tax=Eimeria maxima TaxID=5804 RepID=U6M4C6_EIMMA|nr:hypothetical protein EMWEY_00055330 [Eimeria maxima]CDJ59047.1 hypothetical protein EMWEY_00055330 [Eimeria maxima]